MSERFTPRERIKKKKDFSHIYTKGERVQSKYFILIFIPNQRGFSRLGVVVNRKIGNSVKRNKIKRWIRELFRRNKELLTVPLDVIFLAKEEIVRAQWKELLSEYQNIIHLTSLKVKK